MALVFPSEVLEMGEKDPKAWLSNIKKTKTNQVL